jgi:hypothetical protein
MARSGGCPKDEHEDGHDGHDAGDREQPPERGHLGPQRVSEAVEDAQSR